MILKNEDCNVPNGLSGERPRQKLIIASTIICCDENSGCVYNRDLDQILKDSELEIESIRTFHFDTTYYVVCKPSMKVKSQRSEEKKIDNGDSGTSSKLKSFWDIKKLLRR